MQANVFNVFVRLSQKALEKSRGEEYPTASRFSPEECQLTDAAFAKLLKDIDSFSGELKRKGSGRLVSK